MKFAKKEVIILYIIITSFLQKRLAEIEKNFNILKENYQMLIDPKFSQIKTSLLKLKDNNFLEEEKQKLKKDMKLFYRYFLLYEESDNILNNYRAKEFSELDPDGMETYFEMQKLIKFLNDIKINEIYKDLRNEEFEEENKEFKILNNNIKNEEKKLENLINSNKDDITIELRKKEIEDMKLILNQLKETKQRTDLRLKEQGELLDNIEKNVVQVEKSEPLITAKEEIQNSDNSKSKKKIYILISVVAAVIFIGVLGGIIVVVASK